MVSDSDRPGLISSIILKVAAPCNLKCTYCYVYNHEDRSYRSRPRYIGDDVFDATLAAISRYCERRGQHSMRVTFHGGEPTLIGPARFGELATRAAAVLGRRLASLSIQTNGTLIDDAWVEVLQRHNTHVGVSLDGPPGIHDAARVTHAGRGSYRAAIAGLKQLQVAGLDPVVLCVINPGVSGRRVYRHFRKLGVRHMDFLLPDVSHDSKARFYGEFGPTPVADYLIPIFDAWIEEDDPAIFIRVFWGLLRQLFGGHEETDAFGNPRMSYLVVETDGSIEALDALRVCESGLGKSGLNVLRSDFDDLRLGLPLVHQAVHEGFPLASQCRSCPERKVCGGGYLPHRYARANGFDNPSVWCADILKLLGHLRAYLAAQPERDGAGRTRAVRDVPKCLRRPRDKNSPPPALPQVVVARTQERYFEAPEQLTRRSK
jgi:uncharacterized protein